MHLVLVLSADLSIYAHMYMHVCIYAEIQRPDAGRFKEKGKNIKYFLRVIGTLDAAGVSDVLP